MGTRAVFETRGEAEDEVPMLALRTAGEGTDTADTGNRIDNQRDQAQKGRGHQELESMVHAQRIASIRAAERSGRKAAATRGRAEIRVCAMRT